MLSRMGLAATGFRQSHFQNIHQLPLLSEAVDASRVTRGSSLVGAASKVSAAPFPRSGQ